MYLIQLLLPLYDNDGRLFAREPFDRVRDELAGRFGGVTAFRLSPAEGLWKEEEGEVTRDRLITYEVMANDLDRAWWSRYRTELEERFRQEEILIRATEVEKL